MITLQYKLPNYSQYQYLSFEGSLIVDNDDLQTISTDWDGESINIANIYNGGFKFSANVKETEYKSLQKLQYAFLIEFLIDNEWKEFTFNKIDIDDIFNEFKKITVFVSQKETKEYSNLILKSDVKEIIELKNPIKTTYDIFLTPLRKNTFEHNVVDDFDNFVADYNKNRQYYDVRLFFNETQYFDFLQKLEKINTTNLIELQDIGINFANWQITTNKKIIKNLYQIDLQLIIETNITTIY